MKLKKGDLVVATKGHFTGIRTIESTKDRKNGGEYPIRLVDIHNGQENTVYAVEEVRKLTKLEKAIK